MRRLLSSPNALRTGFPAILFLLLVLTGCGQRATPQFVGDAAWEYLVQQCEFGPRPPGSAAHDRTRMFIIEHVRDSGATVTVQRFSIDDPYGSGELAMTNIVASFYPDEKKRFLLAAHYDTRPWADQESDSSLWSQPILGANDAASGVGVLLEVAAVLADRRPPNLGVDLVFFDGEDYGKSGDLQYYLLGSRYFAANLRGYRPRAGIVIDMVGGRDARIGREGNSVELAPELTELVFARALALDLDVFVPDLLNPVWDDHMPLLQAGIPMVDLIGMPYAQWHTLADTPDACAPETLRQVGTLLVDLIYNFPY